MIGQAPNRYYRYENERFAITLTRVPIQIVGIHISFRWSFLGGPFFKLHLLKCICGYEVFKSFRLQVQLFMETVLLLYFFPSDCGTIRKQCPFQKLCFRIPFFYCYKVINELILIQFINTKTNTLKKN